MKYYPISPIDPLCTMQFRLQDGHKLYLQTQPINPGNLPLCCDCILQGANVPGCMKCNPCVDTFIPNGLPCDCRPVYCCFPIPSNIWINPDGVPAHTLGGGITVPGSLSSSLPCTFRTQYPTSPGIVNAYGNLRTYWWAISQDPTGLTGNPLDIYLYAEVHAVSNNSIIGTYGVAYKILDYSCGIPYFVWKFDSSVTLYNCPEYIYANIYDVTTWESVCPSL